MSRENPHVRTVVNGTLDGAKKYPVTSKGTFREGRRTYPTDGKDSVYLCPDLISERDGKKVSLAKVLDEVGVKPGATIDVDIVGNRWAI